MAESVIKKNGIFKIKKEQYVSVAINNGTFDKTKTITPDAGYKIIGLSGWAMGRIPNVSYSGCYVENNTIHCFGNNSGQTATLNGDVYVLEYKE